MNKVILNHFIVVPTNYLIPLCGSREIVVVTRYTIANFCVRRKEQRCRGGFNFVKRMTHDMKPQKLDIRCSSTYRD
jgi:hypothetical protein